MTLTAIDLCAGAGGLSLGLQRAGFDVLGVELDADACETHRRNVGPCEQASIVGWHPPGRADLVAGGVPCQPFSDAGKREGTARDDGRLYLELVRIGVEADAGALLLENVPGLVSWRDEDRWLVVARIEDAYRRAGYEPRRLILCAADYGTPQLRYRVAIVGFRSPEALARFRWPAPTHAESPGLFGLTRWTTVRDALGLSGHYRSGAVPWTTRTAGDGLGGMRMLDVDRAAPTITGGGNLDWLAPEGGEIRRLTIPEASLLQGFPPGFAFVGNAESRARQNGNAVPPQLAEAVGRGVARALRP